MCYDIEEGYKRRIKEGIRMGASREDINYHIDEFNRRFPDRTIPRLEGGYHLSGFTHPELPIFCHTTGDGLRLKPMIWGLIPNWCKDREAASKQWNLTLNARSESMYEKPSFRRSAEQKRGIVLLNSFYEHHRFGKEVYPFNIRLRSGEPMFVAVLWEEWIDSATGEAFLTFSIVTVEANELMAAIHNNPKLDGPRMPLILEIHQLDDWLLADGPNMKNQILSLCKPLASHKLKAQSVQKLHGKLAKGDVEAATAAFDYPELAFNTQLLEHLN